MAHHTVDCSGSLFFTTRYSLTVDVDSCYIVSNLGKMMMMTPGFRVNKDTGRLQKICLCFRFGLPIGLQCCYSYYYYYAFFYFSLYLVNLISCLLVKGLLYYHCCHTIPQLCQCIIGFVFSYIEFLLHARPWIEYQQ